MPAFDPKNPMKNPIRLTNYLPFPEADKEKYPWLGQEDRYYSLDKQLGSGGFATAFLGYPCDSKKKRIPSAEPVVIKLPNFDSYHLSKETSARLAEIRDKVINEWELIRAKLVGCKHANPIFDMGPLSLDQRPWDLWITIQPYLSNALPLDEWLVKQELRAKPCFDADGKEQPWGGILEWKNWLDIVTVVGEGLVEIHKRRIVHGDLWPPNIYISNNPASQAVFIDFGESFGVTPNGDSRNQPNHTYRAPERGSAEYVATEQVDVYSFGKLMLYLVLGENFEIPSKEDGQPLYGHRRRAHIRSLLFRHKANANMVRQHPELLDIVSQCTELDPVARPPMLEVCDQLREMSRSGVSQANQDDLSHRLAEIASNATGLAEIAKKANLGKLDNVFLRFIDRKIVELERLIESCQTEMVEVTSTRDGLIASLSALFEELSAGDSWTTLTSPSVWQKDGLGLDGRYTSATVHAVRRKAAVHRTYTVSVEELGEKWVADLAVRLYSTQIPELMKLGDCFVKAIAEFRFLTNQGKCIIQNAHFVSSHQRQFALVIESLANMVELWDLGRYIYRGRFVDIQKTPGFFLGLVPVATLAQVREKRTQEMPASLMHVGTRPNREDQWLLVVTDIRGRNENEAPDQPLGQRLVSGSWTVPQLRRVRVYKSVLGHPKDRIISLERLMTNSFNIGAHIREIASCITEMSLPKLAE